MRHVQCGYGEVYDPGSGRCGVVCFPGREDGRVCTQAGRDLSIRVGILWAWRMRKQASGVNRVDGKVEHQGGRNGDL